jgi:hypothetical protein
VINRQTAKFKTNARDQTGCEPIVMAVVELRAKDARSRNVRVLN